MSRLLEGLTCIVTGGLRGIGKAISLAFLNEGAYVVIIAKNKRDCPDWVQHACSDGRAELTFLDVSESSQVKESIMDIKRRRGSIDVLVNNAGVEFNELIAMNDEDHMHQMFETNVYGTILMTQYVSRVMRQKKNPGAIINISSGVALRGNVGQAVYGATKGAVISFTKSAAKELAIDGIRVNAIAPGLVDTDMFRSADSSAIDRRIKAIPMGRLGLPMEIADACVFLASEKSSYITGQTLSVDGSAVL